MPMRLCYVTITDLNDSELQLVRIRAVEDGYKAYRAGCGGRWLIVELRVEDVTLYIEGRVKPLIGRTPTVADPPASQVPRSHIPGGSSIAWPPVATNGTRQTA